MLGEASPLSSIFGYPNFVHSYFCESNLTRNGVRWESTPFRVKVTRILELLWFGMEWHQLRINSMRVKITWETSHFDSDGVELTPRWRHFRVKFDSAEISITYTEVTPSRKAVPKVARKAIFTKKSETWLASWQVTGSTWCNYGVGRDKKRCNVNPVTTMRIRFTKSLYMNCAWSRHTLSANFNSVWVDLSHDILNFWSRWVVIYFPYEVNLLKTYNQYLSLLHCMKVKFLHVEFHNGYCYLVYNGPICKKKKEPFIELPFS